MWKKVNPGQIRDRRTTALDPFWYWMLQHPYSREETEETEEKNEGE